MAELRKLQRIGKVVAAAKHAELARLGAIEAQVDRELAEADRLRTLAMLPARPMDATDMIAHANWQALLLDRARAADQRAEGARAEAAAQRTRLSRAMAREDAADRLISEQRVSDRMVAQRREDDWTPPRT